ncbi:MAG: hypothetical protein ACJ8AW_10430 [Rhodopila sp.]
MDTAIGASDNTEAAADQSFDVRIGFGNGAKYLPSTSPRFDIADPHFQMPLAVFAATDEGRIQGHRDRLRRRFQLGRGITAEHIADFQDATAQGLDILACVNREHLRQHVSGHPIGQQGREMRLKPIQFWCRAAMRWPTMPGFAATAPGTTKAGKPQRDLAGKRRNHVVPIILHMANDATASAIRPSKGMAPGLRGNDLLLEARQQQLSFGQGQPQVGDFTEIIRSVDRHDVDGVALTVSREFHQPHNPSHPSTSGQRTDAQIPLRRSHPQICDGPQSAP